MKSKVGSKMEKAEHPVKHDIQIAEENMPSPNTRRRLKLHRPKLAIKIPPFLKRSHHGHSDENHEFHDDDSPCEFVASHSLPNESHMPSRMFDNCDVHLYDQKECDDAIETSCNEATQANDETDNVNHSSDDIEDEEDEIESEKQQSDKEENEKDSQSRLESDEPKTCDSKKVAERAATPPPASVRKSCLKSCLKNQYHGRRRASTFPGPDDEKLHEQLQQAIKRCVHFSPDTVDPTPRNCKYREWIELHCKHPKSPPVNIKHEKRKCQLNQMRKVNISDYMSKNYGSSFFSPIGSFGGDMLL